ncbi:MAG: hypothetical protein FH748_10565 [Balneolaceae bacterium]|nr:hypothetical protein [Balneolaceae bacterium]
MRKISIVLFLVGGLFLNTLASNLSLSSIPPCENDDCAGVQEWNGHEIGICTDPSNVPGGQDGYNCDAEMGGCLMDPCYAV